MSSITAPADKKPSRVMVTGSAGFIGFHLALRLLADGFDVVGVDGMTDYYDVGLKQARHAVLRAKPGFSENTFMLENMQELSRLVAEEPPDAIVHLGAQAGVRYSLENPRAYVDANLVGTFNVMEVARTCAVRHLMLASTSSVYGANTVMPFVETERADHPLTLYAATKKATEQMAHAYSHLWGLPTTVLRFFTVYGPWGRPDMALFKFVEGILSGEPIDIYNKGDMARDFTYVADLVEAMTRLLAKAPVLGEPATEVADSLSPVAPWRVVNIGRGEPVRLLDFVSAIEEALGRKAILNLLPMQAGDVPSTFADSRLLAALTGYRPATGIIEGVKAFCDWHQSYYRAIA